MGVAGDVNVSVSYEGRFAGGLALSKRTSLTAAPGRPARQFQMYTQVDSVSPSTGSLAGGTLVTIKGRGFPNSAMPGNNAVTALRVGGMACQVVSSNFSTIICMTQADAVPLAVGMEPSSSGWCRWNSSSNSSSAVNTTDGSNSTAVNATSTNSTDGAVCWNGSIKGVYPGMRGVMFEFFNR